MANYRVTYSGRVEVDTSALVYAHIGKPMTKTARVADLKPGEVVTRILAGVPMELRVTEVREDRIICGYWEFDPATGAEIDDDLNWGPPPKRTGSYIQIGRSS